MPRRRHLAGIQVGNFSRLIRLPVSAMPSDACLKALTYLEQSPARGGRAWRETISELRAAILAAGGELPRTAGDEAWRRLG